MVGVVNATLNVAAGVMFSILLFTSVRPDLFKLVGITYAVLFVIAFFIEGGGQINAGITMGFVAYALLDMVGTDNDLPDSIVKQREKVEIFKGVMNGKANIGKTYNTYDPLSPSYKRLSKSINRMGGAQFSYSFWITFDKAVSDAEVAGKTIFMRGDNVLYTPKVSLAKDPELPADNYFKNVEDYVIACPRVSFVSSNQIAVDINTDRDLRSRFLIGNDDGSEEMQKNILSLIPGHFALMTFVFEDNVGIDSFEKGVRMKFYFNDHLYYTGTTPGALKQNTAPIHLFLDPDPSGKTGIDGLKIADFTYYNYALSDSNVAATYSKGFTNKPFIETDSLYNKDVRLHTAFYNDLDYKANYNDKTHTYPSASA